MEYKLEKKKKKKKKGGGLCLSDVLDEIIKFLTEYDNQTIIMHLKMKLLKLNI